MSASPPYERVPNISLYTFNNLFIIYLLHELSSFIRTIYIRNQNIISANHPKNCFKFEITLLHFTHLSVAVDGKMAANISPLKTKVVLMNMMA